jgi:hypothetical protein
MYVLFNFLWKGGVCLDLPQSVLVFAVLYRQNLAPDKALMQPSGLHRLPVEYSGAAISTTS